MLFLSVLLFPQKLVYNQLHGTTVVSLEEIKTKRKKRKERGRERGRGRGRGRGGKMGEGREKPKSGNNWQHKCYLASRNARFTLEPFTVLLRPPAWLLLGSQSRWLYPMPKASQNSNALKVLCTLANGLYKINTCRDQRTNLSQLSLLIFTWVPEIEVPRLAR